MMPFGHRRWGNVFVSAGGRRRQPWVLTGLLVIMLGATWVMQGLDVVDGAFFSNRIVSVALGSVTVLCGAALMLGVTIGGCSAKP